MLTAKAVEEAVALLDPRELVADHTEDGPGFTGFSDMPPTKKSTSSGMALSFCSLRGVGSYIKSSQIRC